MPGVVNNSARGLFALYTDRYQMAIDKQGRYGLELQALHQRLTLGMVHVHDLEIDVALLRNLPPDRFGPATRRAPIRYQ
jgi:hypothetical protein